MFGWRGKKEKTTEHDHICSLTPEERTKEYLQTARERWETCWMIQAAEGWKVEAGKNEIEGCVGSHHFKEFGKIHRIKGLVDAPPSAVFEQLVHGDNESPAWNPTVAECRTLETINENTDIAYNVAREAAGGLVAGRDFVNLRHWKEKQGVMVSLGWSVCHPDMPPTKKQVRAENRPSFWTFEADKEDKNKCHFALYTRIDLRGWLPHYLVEQAMVGVLSNYLVYLRARMEHLKSLAKSPSNALSNGEIPTKLPSNELSNGEIPSNDISSSDIILTSDKKQCQKNNSVPNLSVKRAQSDESTEEFDSASDGEDIVREMNNLNMERDVPL